MSNPTLSTGKKRPSKLSPIIQVNDQTSSIEHPAHRATSNGKSLDSSVEVNFGDQKNILIGPDSLVVTKQLGRGQYGIVERVRHDASGHQCAVKRVPLKGDDNECRRLLMDIDILVKGSECENIIKFYGALIWEGDLWILMELMDCSLDKFYRLAHKRSDTPPNIGFSNLSQPPVSISLTCPHLSPVVEIGSCNTCNPIPEKVVGRMTADVLKALNYLYSIKVIHRDIKPSNILINQAGVIKLCDFGISGYLVNSVARTYEAGCRPYMAPERIDPRIISCQKGYDIKSDIWSLGITMLEIATGRYPYHTTLSFFEQLKSICTDVAPRLPEGRFSSTFQDFIDQCLKKDYQSRPKYDALQLHSFIEVNKDLDIKDFTEMILSRLDTS